MIEKWKKITEWLAANAPHLLDALLPGAVEADFETLEKLTGLVLPDSFKAFYRIHNGQNPHAEGIWAGEEFLSTQRIASEWVIWKQLLDQGHFKSSKVEADKGIRKEWWSPGWIPITYDGAGNHDCLDLAPDPSGESGQILRLWHDDPERFLVAGSMEEWVDFLVDDFASGALVYDEVHGIVEAEDMHWDDAH